MTVLHALFDPLGVVVSIVAVIGGVLIARNELADWNDRRELRRQLREAPIPASELPERSSHCRVCRKSQIQHQSKKQDEYGRYLWTYQPTLKGQPCPENCESKAERHLHVRCEYCGAEYAMKG